LERAADVVIHALACFQPLLNVELAPRRTDQFIGQVGEFCGVPPGINSGAGCLKFQNYFNDVFFVGVENVFPISSDIYNDLTAILNLL